MEKKQYKEDNDLKAIGIYRKISRYEKVEKFKDYKDKLLESGYNLTEYESQGKITIDKTIYGIVDYYPKADRILIRDGNTWESFGLKWIIDNLL